MDSLVTDIGVATRLVALEDDPTLPVFTFQMWFLGIGLSCFSAVLGQIFVVTEFLVSVSQDYFLHFWPCTEKNYPWVRQRTPQVLKIRYRLSAPPELGTLSKYPTFIIIHSLTTFREHVTITIFASTAADLLFPSASSPPKNYSTTFN